MEVKFLNPKLRQDRLANALGCPNSTLQRNRHDINMLSPFKNPSNTHRRTQNTSSDLKRPQMASKESMIDFVESNRKSKLKRGDPN